MRSSGRRRFSLIEVMVATGLLVVMLLAVAYALHGSQQVDALSRERFSALAEARSRLEDALATPTAELPGRNGEAFEVYRDPIGRRFPLTAEDGAPPGRLYVTRLPDGATRVVVTVRWRSRTGGAASVTLGSLAGSLGS